MKRRARRAAPPPPADWLEGLPRAWAYGPYPDPAAARATLDGALAERGLATRDEPTATAYALVELDGAAWIVRRPAWPLEPLPTEARLWSVPGIRRYGQLGTTLWAYDADGEQRVLDEDAPADDLPRALARALRAAPARVAPLAVVPLPTTGDADVDRWAQWRRDADTVVAVARPDGVHVELVALGRGRVRRRFPRAEWGRFAAPMGIPALPYVHRRASSAPLAFTAFIRSELPPEVDLGRVVFTLGPAESHEGARYQTHPFGELVAVEDGWELTGGLPGLETRTPIRGWALRAWTEVTDEAATGEARRPTYRPAGEAFAAFDVEDDARWTGHLVFELVVRSA